MGLVAAFVTGRRTKWLVLLGWLALAAVFAPLGAKVSQITDNRTESFLPKNAESTRVLRLFAREYDGSTVDGLIVYRRPGGLTATDRARIANDARRAAARLPLVSAPVVPFAPGSPPSLVAPDRSLAYTIVAVPDDNAKLADWGKELRGVVAGRDGLQTYVTGALGINADFQEVFGNVDTKLLFATVLLVLVLLGAIYRALVVALIPLVVVGVAYAIASGLIYLYGRSGATVSQNATTILVVLMFGVGTDYCLLLVSRYREELRHAQDKHEAMAHAMRRAGPAILASGLTVVLAMLVLLVARLGSTQSLGPVAAIGVGVALLAGLTLLPALLAIAGRRGFWPRRRLVALQPDAEYHEREGAWRRLGDRVLRRPGAALAATLALFVVGGLGLLAYKEDYSANGFFKKSTESVTGFDLLARSFPAGALAPTTVVVVRDGGAVTAADVAAVRRRLATVPRVAAIGPAQPSRDGRVQRLSVVFSDDPFAASALARVSTMRERLAGLGPGVHALVGAGSAVQEDYNATAARDLRVIVPLALLVIAAILGVLLRAVVAPIVLMATVVISFFGTLGLSLLFFRYVAGDAGVDVSLPTYAFIFLVALGTDYTIFLMSRVREEARVVGTREGMLRALAVTGPVITSAGVILAGTFAVLMTLPVTIVFDIGFMVAVGILLDTFVVRTIMVPAAVEVLGDRIWWPSGPGGGGRALGERPVAADPARAA
ncbi:MAG: putative drug exporter of the superfamily [Solirubrobacteraceae bacterium]|nr:putative drug exporter of the superfamily [Solirubrobacteraceae bacterium]